MHYRDRLKFIIPYVKDKKVLDLGCIGHEHASTDKENWLHRHIRKHAKTVVGVDIQKSEISKLRKEGYDVIHADVETMDIPDKFEVIVAGDIMEHLSNCGKFLTNASNHLVPDGIILLSTPNPINFLRFVSILLLGKAGEMLNILAGSLREHCVRLQQGVIS